MSELRRTDQWAQRERLRNLIADLACFALAVVVLFVILYAMNVPHSY
jgi:hypothetical protein